MFSSLRTNNQFIILHKEANPYVEIGSVVNVTQPAPRYQNQVFGAPQEMVVDVTVKVGEQSFTFQKLPANADIADFGQNGNIVVACSRDDMNSEISSMKQKSNEILNSIDYHKSVIAGCDKMLEVLNPEFAEKQRQDKEMKEMKEELSDIKGLLKQLAASGVVIPDASQKVNNNNNNNNNNKK